ncbi:MAG: 2OG-Fe dioxygenase family protein [Polyangiales bacterium]
MREDRASLPLDAHLRDGGRYRRRRHACFIATREPSHEPRGPPRAPAARGVQRAPRRDAPLVRADARRDRGERRAFTRLLRALSDACTALRPTTTRWFVEAHQFRIDTSGGIGRPTPEGAHRDGVDFVALLLVSRVGVKGGETRVFEAHGARGERFTLTEPWTMLLLDDARVIHETTPIQPSAPDGRRDTLVVTLRAGAFLDEAPA